MPATIVLIAGPNPLRGTGGHSRYVRAHGRAVLALGFQPHVFCCSEADGITATDFGLVHHVCVSRMPVGRFRKHLNVWHLRLLAAEVGRFARAGPGPYLFHGFGVWGWASVRARAALQGQGIQATSIVSAYDTLEHEVRAKLNGLQPAHGFCQRLGHQAELFWTRLVVDRHERRGYTGAQLVLVNYESVRRLLRNRYGLADKVRKLPYTSESAFLSSPERGEVPPGLATLQPQQAPLLVSVSRHDPRKGVDVFLHALAELRGAGIPFRACLLGTGPLLPAHRRLAEQLHLGRETAILGFVPDPQLYLQHADVFVLPSLEEGSGSLSLIEALQASLPVVASNIDGIPEDVTDGDSAMLVEPGNPAALSAVLARVITDLHLRQRLARRAHETFLERFSAEAFTRALRHTYAELGFVANSPGTRPAEVRFIPRPAAPAPS